MGHLLTVEPQRSGSFLPLEFSRQAKPQAKNSSVQTFVLNQLTASMAARERDRIGIVGINPAVALGS